MRSICVIVWRNELILILDSTMPEIIYIQIEQDQVKVLVLHQRGMNTDILYVKL